MRWTPTWTPPRTASARRFAPGPFVGPFRVGDGHAAQGQGEVDQTAMGTGLRGKFQLIVRKDMKITWPRGETPTHWIVMGLNPNLEDAMKMAVRETILFIVQWPIPEMAVARVGGRLLG
jgi:acetamidase/formamidase